MRKLDQLQHSGGTAVVHSHQKPPETLDLNIRLAIAWASTHWNSTRSVMIKRRIWILSTFAVLALLAFLVAGTDAQPGTVKQIVPGVWFREGIAGQFPQRQVIREGH